MYMASRHGYPVFHEETVSFSLEVNTERADKSLRRVQTVLYQTLSLLRRLSGGNENVREVIDQLQTLNMVLNRVRLTAELFLTASGPIGWALFAISAASTAVTIGELKAAE